MSKLLIPIIIFLTACSNSNSQNLVGQIFEISVKHKDCSIIADCSCCDSELFFISDTLFCLIDYCHDENQNMIGTYKINSDSLVLTFNSKLVRLGVKWKGKRKESEYKTYLLTEYINRKPLVFKLSKCNDNLLMLNNNEFKRYKVGLRTKFNDENERMKDLLNSVEWKEIVKEK